MFVIVCAIATGGNKSSCSCSVSAIATQAISLVFFTETWKPDSFYSRIVNNRRNGLHTLVLLDIKVKEPSEESLARGKPVYLPPRCNFVWPQCFQSLPCSIDASLSTRPYMQHDRLPWPRVKERLQRSLLMGPGVDRLRIGPTVAESEHMQLLAWCGSGLAGNAELLTTNVNRHHDVCVLHKTQTFQAILVVLEPPVAMKYEVRAPMLSDEML